jgi:hypothetical protein
MSRRIALAAMAAAAGLLLSSCIGVESRVTFHNDGSGVLKIEYRIAKSLTDLGKEGASQIPLPVGEEELRKALSDAKGVKLMGTSRREDEKDVYIAAEVSFNRIESLAEVEAFKDMPMSLERSGSDFVFRQVISGAAAPQGADAAEAQAPAAGAAAATAEAGAQAAPAESDKELAAMFSTLLEGYELIFSVNAPRPIKSSSAGEISADRRTVTYRLPVEKVMDLPPETAFTVTW